MNPDDTLAYATKICRLAKCPVSYTGLHDFVPFARAVNEALRDLTPSQKAKLPELRDWANSWLPLLHNFDKKVKADPFLVYKPANRMAREFHESEAFVRMLCAGNRTSKTWSAYIETARAAMRRNPVGWRKYPNRAGNAAIMCPDFVKSAPAVFEAKYIKGEPQTPFSPIFPEGGKWLHHYDPRAHRIEVACPECAEAGNPTGCTHEKWTITLFSDKEGPSVLQGGAYSIIHFDEHVAEEFFAEGLERTKTVSDACMYITGTPLDGPGSWEQKRIAALAKGDPTKNRLLGKPYASYHTIDQYEAGLTPHEIIDASKAVYDDYEIQARIYGIPVPLVKTPAFNRAKLAEMRKLCTKPFVIGTLRPFSVDIQSGKKTFFDDARLITPETQYEVEANSSGSLRIWDIPVPGAVYLGIADCAIGLAGNDASCLSVVRVQAGLTGTKVSMVAQYHGWINSFEYAVEAMKLCHFYNSALCVVENTGGYGEAVTLKLREYGYWNLYVEESDRNMTEINEGRRVGVNTNVASKPFMVAAMQKLLKDDSWVIPDMETIDELAAYEQKRGEKSLVTTYGAPEGCHDDRAMSLIIGAGVIFSHPIFKFEVLNEVQAADARAANKPDPFWQSIIDERNT